MKHHQMGKSQRDDVVGSLHATSLQHQHPQHQHPQHPQHQHQKNQNMSGISPKSNTVSAIIRSYKSALTFHGKRLGLNNGWQPRFHDHIIRNDADYQRISDYIITNPESWKEDKFCKGFPSTKPNKKSKFLLFYKKTLSLQSK